MIGRTPPWHEPADPYLVRLATAKADLERLRQRLDRLARRISPLSQTVESS